jgi:putative flippase GtrA
VSPDGRQSNLKEAAPYLFRFQAVGILGIGVQLAALYAFRQWLSLPLPVATALAVETAVLHNFLWHVNWTWKDRVPEHGRLRYALQRLWQFNLSTGIFSILANVVITSWLQRYLGGRYLIANLIAIGVAFAGNFLVSHFLVFRKTKSG